MQRIKKKVSLLMIIVMILTTAGASFSDDVVQTATENAAVSSEGLEAESPQELTSDAAVQIMEPPMLKANFALMASVPMGTGTKEDPYLISCIEDFKIINEQPSANFKMMSDIDLAGVEWEPLCQSVPFTGTFDGGGFTIRNLAIDKPHISSIGFFSNVKGTIRNVNYVNANVRSAGYAGVIAASCIQGTISNCKVIQSQVEGNAALGGIVGSVDRSSLSNLTVNDSIIGLDKTAYYVGGIAGFATNLSNFNQCSAYVKLVGKNNLGGIVGYANSVEIMRSQSFGYVIGDTGIAGIVTCPDSANLIRVHDSFSQMELRGNSLIGGIISAASLNYTRSISCVYYAGKMEFPKPMKTGIQGIETFSGKGNLYQSYYDMNKAQLGQYVLSGGKSTIDMMQKKTYGYWGFGNTWAIDEKTSYPSLIWFTDSITLNSGLVKKSMESATIDPTNGTSFTKGDGSKENPYEIENVDQLKLVTLKPTLSYKLTKDIDLQNNEWTPLCIETPFTGTFDGDSHTISNLKVTKSRASGVGLFSKMNGKLKNLNLDYVVVDGSGIGTLSGGASNAVIENCKVSNVSIKSTLGSIGGVVGGAENTEFRNIIAENLILETDLDVCIGGIAAGTRNCTFSKCSVDGIFNGKSSIRGIGGICGNLMGGKIEECQSFGKIAGTRYLGGILGSETSSGNTFVEISNCMSQMDIDGINNIYGIGYLHNPKSFIKNSFYAGKLTNVKAESLSPITFSNYSPLNCYYDAEKLQIISNPERNVPKLTVAMLQKNTYNGWDFDNVWSIVEGKSYPILKFYGKSRENASPQIENGNGSKENPYEIRNKSQLKLITFEPSAHYKLMNDIDLSGEVWTPLCFKSMFTGSLDGNGFSILNMRVNSNEQYSGFFYRMNGEVKNITFRDAIVTGTVSCAVISGDSNNAKYNDCTVVGGKISGNSYIGGIVGGAGYSQFNNIKVTNIEIGNPNSINLGGISGSSVYNSFKNCSVNAYLTGQLKIGGICGAMTFENNISNCESFGVIQGSQLIAGIGVAIDDKYSSVKLGIDNCLSQMALKGTSQIGGIVASEKGDITVKNSYFAGKIEGYQNTALGTIGGISSVISNNQNCYYDLDKTKLKPRSGADIGKTTQEMITKTTFSGWDFEQIWMIKNGVGYPRLRNLLFNGEAVEILTPPTKIVVSDVTSRSFKVSWEAVNGATEYDIKINGNLLNTKNNEINVTDLEPESSYKICVVSKKNKDYSFDSETKTATTLSSTIATPKIKAADFKNNQLIISWTPISGIKKYELSINGEVIAVTGVKGTYTVKDIKDNTLYQIKVRAIGLKDKSKWSDLVAKKTKDEFGMSGQGTDADPYVIMEEAHFARIEKEPSASFALGQDITLTSDWKPLCMEKPFTGKLFGNKKKITGLNIIQKNQQNIGFIATAKGAEISNLEFENPNINSEGTNVGVLIGKSEQIKVSNVNVTGATVEGNQYVAGLIGLINDMNAESKTLIENCHVSSSNIKCKGSYTAGLIASITNGRIIKSSFNGTIVGSVDYIGGLVSVANRAKIEQNYTYGQILGKSYLAGLCSSMINSSLENCFSRMEIKIQNEASNFLAGLVSNFTTDGNAAYFVKNCYFNGKITRLPQMNTKVGGIVHTANRTDSFTNNYYDGLKLGVDNKFIQDPQNSRMTGAMKSQSNYTGWDFDKIWIIDDGRTYPSFIDGESFEDPDGDLYKNQPPGAGTESNPYLLAIPEHFKFIEVQPNAWYKVINDIDFTGYEWQPLCKDRSFSGKIEGSGFALKNIRVNSLTQANLIQTMDKATIQNINFENLSIQGDDEAYLFKQVTNSQIKNINFSGSITSTKGKAALIQSLTSNSVLENLYTNVNVTAKDSANAIAETSSGCIFNRLLIEGTLKANLSTGVAQYFSGTANEIHVNAHIVANKGYGFTAGADNATIKNTIIAGIIESEDGVGTDVSCIGLLQDANKGTKTTVENVIVYAKLKAKRGTTYPIIVNDSSNILTTNTFFIGDYMKQVPLTAKQSEQSLLSQDMNTVIAKFKDADSNWSTQDSYLPLLKFATGKVNNTQIQVVQKMNGDGTKENPFVIENQEQANLMKYAVNKSFKLANDIDLETVKWIPVGTKEAPFMGEFNGNGFTISNLKVDYVKNSDWTDSNYKYKDFGLFGAVKNTTVSNLVLKDCHITTELEYDFKSGLVSGSIESSTVKQIGTKGENTVDSFIAGGLGGYALNSNLSNLRINATLHGDNCVGGILGKADKTAIDDAVAIVTADTVNKSVGGLVGYAYNLTSLCKCYASVKLKGKDEVGGVIGLGKNISILNTGANGTLKSESQAQGIIGKLCDYNTDKNTIDKVYSACKVESMFTDVAYLANKPANMTLSGVYLLDPKSTSTNLYSKTDKQLKQKETFVNYDFDKVWSIEQNLYYPLLKGAEKFIKMGFVEDVKLEEIILNGVMDDDGLKLNWSSATAYNLYKVYVNNKLVYEGESNTFIFKESIEEANVSVYVEGFVTEAMKMKSNSIVVPTIIFRPQNLKYEILEKEVKLTWDCNVKNCNHTIELNGKKVGITTGHEYIFLIKDLRKENIVRVMNQKGNRFSKWSNPMMLSLVDPSFKGVRVVELERGKVSGRTQVKAQLMFSNIQKPYAGYFVVKFDPKRFKIDEASVKEAFEASTTYLKVAVDNENGYMKILFTKKAESDTKIESLINFNVLLIKNMTGQLEMSVLEVADEEQLLIENTEFLNKEIIPIIED